MKKAIAVAVSVVAMIVGGLTATAGAAPPGPDPLSTIIEKLDYLLTAVGDLQGVTQNWDKALPANDPGGPCPSSSSRFTCVLGGAAVRDNQTGLVWDQAPATTKRFWRGGGSSAREACVNRTTGGQKGWRLPSVHELASLIDPTQQDPALPAGHPFSNVQFELGPFDVYWSATEESEWFAWSVGFKLGTVGVGDKNAASGHVWCVRGGMNADRY